MVSLLHMTDAETGKNGGEEKGIVNRVRPFYSRQRRLARSADLELGGENGSRGESVSTDGDEREGVQQCWTPGKKKRLYIIYIRPESSHLSRRRAIHNTQAARNIIHKGGRRNNERRETF